MSGENRLLFLCDAADIVECQRKPEEIDCPTTLTRAGLNLTVVGSRPKRRYVANINARRSTPKVSKHVIAKFIEGTSDELSKKFYFTCKVCKICVDSYGSNRKAYDDIKLHVLEQHLSADSCIEVEKNISSRTTSTKKGSAEEVHSVDETSKISKPTKRLRSVKTAKTVPDKETVKNAVMSQIACKATKKVGVRDVAKTLEVGPSDHSYSLKPDDGEPSKQKKGPDLVCGYSSAFEYSDVSIKQLSYNPLTIPTPPFPFIYDPFPLEASHTIELNSNGDSVECDQSDLDEPSNSRISSEKLEGIIVNPLKSKSPTTFNSLRPVLECVENRVTCNSIDSPDLRDPLVPDNSFENSENVESPNDIEQLLKQHGKKRKSHGKPIVYKCDKCDKRFTAKTSLKSHLMSHYDFKPFQCSTCSRRFTRKSSLKYHCTVHTGETRFKCEHCQKRFRHPSHYKDHLLKHTGVTPFSCSLCKMKFQTRNSHKRHSKMHIRNVLPTDDVPISDNN